MGSYTQLSFTEQVKRCSACGEVKARTEFYRATQNRDGLCGRCKSCVYAYNNQWRAENGEYVKAWHRAYLDRPGVREHRANQLRKWKETNAEHHKRQRHEYYLANRDEILRKDKEYKRRNANRYREWKRKYWQENRERLSAHSRAYYRATREQRLAHDKAYREANRDERSRRQRERYHANRDAALESMREYRERPENRERARRKAKEWREANRERFIAHIRNRKLRMKQGARRLDADSISFFAEVRRDPCSYCGKSGGTLDHVVPIAKGGLHHWTNFAGACLECNMRKKTMSALTFLYRSNRRSEG